MCALLARVCLTATLVCTVSAILPAYIKPCRKSDPDINGCITRSIEQLREKLAVGIPELGAPAIEPLHLKQIHLSQGPRGAGLDVNLTDLRVSGPSSFKIRDLEADPENVNFTFKVSFDKLNFEGKYQINVMILVLRLAGRGDLTGSFVDYDSDVVLAASKVYRDNDTYLNFEKMKIKIKIGKATLNFGNLLGGDLVLSAVNRELFNNAALLDEITPVLETSLAELFTDVANKITKSFTYRELFPDD
ncbi:protein takeout [Ptiloglossa arizonensis]|uniref:protein takeout n=1 Tax=Ptiloglossa arizonensis TaxID=3350558 RepID=UPI003F9FC0E9